MATGLQLKSRPRLKPEPPPRFELLRANVLFTVVAVPFLLGAWELARRAEGLRVFWIAAASIFVPAAIAFITMLVRHPPGQAKHLWSLLYSGLIMLLLLASGSGLSIVGVGLVPQGAAALLDLIDARMQQGSVVRAVMVAATALSTAALGALFFIVRLRQRFFYGVAEALSGVAVAAHRISVEPGSGLPSETGFYFAILTAGIYLVVRGLDNMHQGLKDPSPLLLRGKGLLNRALGRKPT